MLPLVVGTLLAVGALAFVLFPLFLGVGPSVARARIIPARSARVAEDEAVVALREIEFDRVTGKLSDGDYAELRTRYTDRALAAMRAGSATVSADAAEAAVAAYRTRMRECARCGPRPEPDATYCSACGTYLPGSCTSCGARVTESGAAFCNSCGHQLAA